MTPSKRQLFSAMVCKIRAVTATGKGCTNDRQIVGMDFLPNLVPPWDPGRDHVSCHCTSISATGGDIVGTISALLPTAGAHSLAEEPPRLLIRTED